MRSLSDFDEDRSLTMGDRRYVFDSFSVEVKLKFERESRRLLGDDVSEITAAKADLRNQILDLKQRQRDAVNDHGLANHTSVCKFGNDDLEQLCDIFNAIVGPTARALNDPLQSPAVPSEPEQQVIIDLEDEITGDRRSCPWFCRHITANRERWSMVAVCNDQFPKIAFLVLLSIKQPAEVTFLELRRLDRVFDPRVAFADSEDWLSSHFTTFDVHPLQHYTETTVPIDANRDIFVLQNCRFDKDYVVAGSSEPFEVFVARHPPVGAQKRVSTRSLVSKPSLSEAQALLLEFPFLTQADLDAALGKKGGGVKAVRKPRVAGRKIDDSSSNSEVVSDDDSKKSDSDVDMVDAVGPAFDAAELDALRDDFREEEEFTHFYVHFRGGHYIFDHDGIVSNCASAQARGAMVKYWCDAYSWQVKYQFHYSVYGHDGAHELAKEVCRRGEFFFLAVVTSGFRCLFIRAGSFGRL